MKEDDKKSLLPYGTNSSAPAITLPDLKLFNSERGSIARNYFEGAADQLSHQFQALTNLAQLNDTIYNASYNFVPRVGQIYHLYEKDDGTHILSMIESWEHQRQDFKFIVSVKFTADSIWKKVEEKT